MTRPSAAIFGQRAKRVLRRTPPEGDFKEPNEEGEGEERRGVNKT
jgi:hypothetical protein